MSLRLAAPAALLFVALASPVAAIAPDTDGDHAKADSVAADAQSDKERKICKYEVATGSVMRKRVCRTVAEIEAAETERMRDLQRNNERQLDQR
jgi:hypothetical protein